MESLAFPSFDPSPPPAFVTVALAGEADPLALAVLNAFQDAMDMRSMLCDAAFEVDGISGKKFKMFLNNLMKELPDPRYLEIGLYHGSTFCSAVYRNRMRAVGMDNWSQFNGQRSIFEKNLAQFKPNFGDIEVMEEDFRAVDYANLGKFNIMFYDGAHEEKDQYDGVYLPASAMELHAGSRRDIWRAERPRQLDRLFDRSQDDVHRRASGDPRIEDRLAQ